MLRTLAAVCLALVLAVPASAGDLKGDYIETRTCDVYTGPCFANAQGGITGCDALMAWSIERGSYDGVELAGLKVVVASTASDTLGFDGGLDFDPQVITSVIIVDEKATAKQRDALQKFAAEHAKHAGEFAAVYSSPIEMNLDHFAVVGKLKVGEMASIETRKLEDTDCVCRNEKVFYPPLNEVKNANPAYTVKGNFDGPGLDSTWANPMSRSSFLASFSY